MAVRRVALFALLVALGAAPVRAFEPPIFLNQFGQNRQAAPFVFGYVLGVAVNSGNGHVFVTDATHLREFEGDGTFVAMRSCSGCRGLDVNIVTGEVYVAQAERGQISRFAPDGSLIAVIGSEGTGTGQFRWPHDVAVDSDTGAFYVMDVLNARVQHFDANGAFIREWGSAGSGDAQFSGTQSPGGIAFDSVNRRVYTSDPSIDTIQKFDEAGNFLARWVPTVPDCGCQSPDEIRWMRNVDVDEEGNVLVADADGERVSVWSPEGVFLESFQGPHDVANGPFHPRAVAANRVTGELYVAAAYAQRVDHFDANHLHVASWGDRQRDGSVLWQPGSIGVSPSTGELYVFAGLQYRIKRFAPWGAFLGEWGDSLRLLAGGSGVAPEGLIPTFRNALTVDASGDVWVITGAGHYRGDPRGYKVQRFGPDGTFESGWLVDDVKQFIVFSGGALEESTGRVFVANSTQGRISMHDAQGNLLREIRGIAGPGGLAVRDGFLYAVEAGSDRLLKFEVDGSDVPVAQWGGSGSGLGQLKLNTKSEIALGHAGHVFVADTGNHRIQVFDANGVPLGTFGGNGSGPGQFRSPKGVAIGRDGVFHVVDSGNGRVQSFLVDLLTECGDGLDNDGDGAIDAADPQCPSRFGLSEAPAARCGLGFETALLLLSLLWLRWLRSPRSRRSVG